MVGSERAPLPDGVPTLAVAAGVVLALLAGGASVFAGLVVWVLGNGPQVDVLQAAGPGAQVAILFRGEASDAGLSALVETVAAQLEATRPQPTGVRGWGGRAGTRFVLRTIVPRQAAIVVDQDPDGGTPRTVAVVNPIRATRLIGAILRTGHRLAAWGGGVAPAVHRRDTVILPFEDGTAVAVHGGTLLVGTDVAALGAALDRLDGTCPATPAGDGLARRLADQGEGWNLAFAAVNEGDFLGRALEEEPVPGTAPGRAVPILGAQPADPPAGGVPEVGTGRVDASPDVAGGARPEVVSFDPGALAWITLALDVESASTATGTLVTAWSDSDTAVLETDAVDAACRAIAADLADQGIRLGWTHRLEGERIVTHVQIEGLDEAVRRLLGGLAS